MRPLLAPPSTAALLVLGCALHAPPVHAQEPELFDSSQVRTLELSAPEGVTWNQVIQGYGSGEYLPVDLTVDGGQFPRVGLRARGQTSFLCVPGQKKPLKLKLDAFVDGQELWGQENLRLNNACLDPTFTRDVVLGEVFARYVPTTRRALVQVTWNGADRGVYVLEEAKDAAFLRRNFGTGSGHRYKAYYPFDLAYLGDDPEPYAKGYDLKTPDRDGAWTGLIEVARTLDAVLDGRAPLAVLQAVFDVESALWVFAVSAVFGHWDSYHTNAHNWYLIEETPGGRHRLMQHDIDQAWGSWGGGNLELPLGTGLDRPKSPLCKLIQAHPELRAEFEACARTVLHESLNPSRLAPRIAELQALVEPQVRADPHRVFPLEAFRGNLEEPVHGSCGSAPGLLTFVQARSAFLHRDPALERPDLRVVELELEPAQPTAGDAPLVRVTLEGDAAIERAVVRWRTGNGAWIETTLVGEGPRREARLPALPGGARLEYLAVVDAGARVVHPARGNRAAFTADIGLGSSPVHITEYLYSGRSGEWVELTNTSGAPVDLRGWSLDDRSARPGSFDLSPAGELAPGASIVVTGAEPEAFAVSWGLDRAQVLGPLGEVAFGRADAIHLFDASGALRDRVRYDDKTLHRCPRAKGTAASPLPHALGADNASAWRPADDHPTTVTSREGDRGSPGHWKGNPR